MIKKTVQGSKQETLDGQILSRRKQRKGEIPDGKSAQTDDLLMMYQTESLQTDTTRPRAFQLEKEKSLNADWVQAQPAAGIQSKIAHLRGARLVCGDSPLSIRDGKDIFGGFV